MAFWDTRIGYEDFMSDVAAAELPRGPLSILRRKGPIRADARGLQTADGKTLPWDQVDRVMMKRNLLGVPHLRVALKDGGRSRVGVPLGVPISSVDRLIEVVDRHFRPAR
jgi:hypothetical protein